MSSDIRRRLREPTRRQSRVHYDDRMRDDDDEGGGEPAAKRTRPSDINYKNILLQSQTPQPTNNEDIDCIYFLQPPGDIQDDSKKRGGRRSLWIKKKLNINFREYVAKDAYRVVIRFRKCSRRDGDMNYLPADLVVQVNDHHVNPPPLHPDLQGRANAPLIVPKHFIRSKEILVAFKSSEFTPGNFLWSVEVSKLTTTLAPHSTTGLHYRRTKVVKENIRTSLSSEADIQAVSLTLSLICPIGQKRIEVPGRSSTCSHFQCFDVLSFLVLYAGKEGKKHHCPVCHAAIWQNSLFIDQYMEEILRESDTDKVEFDLDGEWKSVKEGRLQSTNVETVGDTPRRTSKPGKQEDKKKTTAIDLTYSGSSDSDDSDLDSDSECPCLQCKKENREKADREPVVVDLTLDSE